RTWPRRPRSGPATGRRSRPRAARARAPGRAGSRWRPWPGTRAAVPKAAGAPGTARRARSRGGRDRPGSRRSSGTPPPPPAARRAGRSRGERSWISHYTAVCQPLRFGERSPERMREYLRVARLYIIVLAIFTVGRLAVGFRGVPYERGHHLFSLVIMTLMAS